LEGLETAGHHGTREAVGRNLLTINSCIYGLTLYPKVISTCICALKIRYDYDWGSKPDKCSAVDGWQ